MRTIERWGALSYQPPLRVVIGMKKPLTARVVTAGSEIDRPEFIEVEVFSGPAATLPIPPTVCEFNRAMDEEWLRREWELSL